MPASTLDVLAVFEWLLADGGYAASQIALLGGSSGASTVLLALQEMARRNMPMPACGVPISAWHAHSDDGAERTTEWTQQWVAWQMNCGNIDLDGKRTGLQNDVRSPVYSFLHGSFARLCPLYVVVGGQESQADLKTSLRLVEVARRAGVKVRRR